MTFWKVLWEKVKSLKTILKPMGTDGKKKEKLILKFDPKTIEEGTCTPIKTDFGEMAICKEDGDIKIFPIKKKTIKIKK